MKNNIEKAVKLFIYLTFIVPVVVVPSSFIFPFIVPKILLFRSLVVIILAGYVLLMLVNWKQYRPYFTPVNIVVALFLLSFTLSTIFGTDPYHSFWDNHERMLGLFTILHYVIYYFVCTAVFQKWKEWQMAMRMFLIGGSVVMFVGVLQIFKPDLLLNMGGTRVIATLGNSIYVGGYGLFLTFMAFLLVVRDKKNSPWFWAEILMGILGFVGIFLSGTRGAVLALLAGMGVGLIGYIIVLRKNVKVRNIMLGVVGLIVIAVALLYSFRKTDFVTNLPAVGRTVNTSLSDVKASPRWVAWEIAYIGWKEMPVFGWGPNNYFYTFNKHYNPKSLNWGYGETWFDNAHNIIMNTLAVQGAFGILVYFAIFIISTIVLWRSYFKYDLNKHVVVIGTAFLATHFVANITVFENPTSYLYYMFWLAFISRISDGKEKSSSSNKKIGYGSMIAVGIFAILILYIFNIQPAKANSSALRSVRLLNQVNISSQPAQILSFTILEVKKTLDFPSPHIDDIRADAARSVIGLFDEMYKKAGADKSKEMLNLAYINLEKNLILHPLDIRNQMTMSQLARMKAIADKDNSYLVKSEKFLEDALSKSPRRQQIIYGLANAKLMLGKKDEATKLFEQAISDNYKIGESHWRLSYMYSQTGEMSKAQKVIDDAKKQGVVFNEREEGIIKSFLK